MANIMLINNLYSLKQNQFNQYKAKKDYEINYRI